MNDYDPGWGIVIDILAIVFVFVILMYLMFH